MAQSIKLLGDRLVALTHLPEAKRLLTLLKIRMELGGHQALWAPPVRFRDGSTMRVGSIFGLDIINIRGSESEDAAGSEASYIEGPCIFLIHDASSFVVWEIGENETGVRDGSVLTTADLNIAAFATYYAIADSRNPSVVKSTTNYSRHVFTIENCRIDTTTFLNPAQYGKVYSVSQIQTALVGVPNSFVGPVFDTDMSYLAYLCSSRHPSYVDDVEGNITDLHAEARVVSGDNYAQIKYNVDGEEREGTLVRLGKIYAVLSKDKWIGRDYAYETMQPIDIWGPGPCGISDMKLYSESGEVHNYRFGSFIIEQHLGVHGYYEVLREYGSGHISDCYNHINEETCHSPPYFCDTWWDVEGHYQNSGQVQPLDYDNRNGDETFIFFYAIRRGLAHKAQHTLTVHWGHPIGTDQYVGTEPIYWRNAVEVEYKFAYRIPGGPLTKLSLAKVTGGTKYLYAVDSTVGYGECERSCPTFYQIPPVTRFEGQRIGNVSCQVTEEFILYSYTLWEYSGPNNEMHFSDQSNDLWTFQGRVVGALHIATGTHTSQFVTSALLGEYAETFDPASMAAIGVHAEESDEEEA